MCKEECYYVKRAYVGRHTGDQCVQVSVPFKKDITIISPNGIEFSNKAGKEVNTYLTDERRFQFPYFDIPKFQVDNQHYAVNQLLDLYKPYIQIIDSVIYESYAAHYKDNRYLYHKVLETRKPYRVTRLTRDKLINSMKPSSEEDKVIGSNLNGDYILNFAEYVQEITTDEYLLNLYHNKKGNCENNIYADANNIGKIPSFELEQNLK